MYASGPETAHISLEASKGKTPQKIQLVKERPTLNHHHPKTSIKKPHPSTILPKIAGAANNRAAPLQDLNL